MRALNDLRAAFPVLRLLVRRDLKVRYADSFLGWLWSFVEPLSFAAIFYVVFSVLLDRGLGQDPYILFMLPALLAWQWTAGSLSGAAKSLTKDKRLVGAVRLPRYIWPLRTVMVKACEFFLALPVVVLVAALFGHAPTPMLLALPLAVLIQATLLVGLSLVLSPIGVLVTDTSNVLALVLRLGFYGSPIFWGLSDVPERYHAFLMINPMAGVIDLYRAAWFADTFAGWAPVLASGGAAVLALVLGALVFRRLERPALKEL